MKEKYHNAVINTQMRDKVYQNSQFSSQTRNSSNVPLNVPLNNHSNVPLDCRLNVPQNVQVNVPLNNQVINECYAIRRDISEIPGCDSKNCFTEYFNTETFSRKRSFNNNIVIRKTKKDELLHDSKAISVNIFLKKKRKLKKKIM
jgi:hypothetical protein